MLCGRCKIALLSPILPSEASDVGVLGGEAVNGTGMSVFILAGGVVVGDLPPGVGGGVGGTLGGGVTGASGGVVVRPASPLC